ncbi:MAG TPA: hypothetical protein VJY33_14595 [Isosphaeraceae bacterium]|nr:hypothetical protein [Isosphaeraceae bacterium]
MRGRRVEDLPEGLTPAAKKARKKFLDQVHRDLEALKQIALTVLVWGQNPEAKTKIAEKRKGIRARLIAEGHNPMLSEEISASINADLTEKTKELVQASRCNFIIDLVEGAPGASAEFHDFYGEPQISHKFLVMVPKAYKEGYSAKGAIASLQREHPGNVFWYDDDDLDKCRVMTEAVQRVEYLREIAFQRTYRDKWRVP